MEKTKLQSRHRERWWQITSYIARSVELAENLWNRKLQLNTLVFLSMRDQSNSNRTVHNTHVKTASSRWQLENLGILSRSLLSPIGFLNSAPLRHKEQRRNCEPALPDLWIQTTVRVGKALISSGQSWAPAQLVRAASPLQHHVHRVKVCPLSARGSASTQHITPHTSEHGFSTRFYK